jgi:multimeric flavodoxin WrbA
VTHDLKPRVSGDDLHLDEAEFKKRYQEHFYDPRFQGLSAEIEKITEQAWKNYQDHRKAPVTRKAGAGFKDPTYDLSVEWIKASEAIKEAQAQFEDKTLPSRVLLIDASSRSDQTCPSEISKTTRMVHIAKKTYEGAGIDVEVLNLNRLTFEYGKQIHPCKACVSTAMPLCHWPCSCYPNHSGGQIHDMMNEIYPMWVRAHAVMIITPVYWHQAPSPLKLMIDRLVCADGGNPDPTSTHGKKAEEAKKIELDGWSYPRHLEGRLYSVIVHGDVTGVDELKTALSNWLEEMSLIPASNMASFSRYIGYYEPYATSHEALDKDQNIQIEVRNAARSVVLSLEALRSGRLAVLDPKIEDPRPK